MVFGNSGWRFWSDADGNLVVEKNGKIPQMDEDEWHNTVVKYSTGMVTGWQWRKIFGCYAKSVI